MIIRRTFNAVLKRFQKRYRAYFFIFVFALFVLTVHAGSTLAGMALYTFVDAFKGLHLPVYDVGERCVVEDGFVTYQSCSSCLPREYKPHCALWGVKVAYSCAGNDIVEARERC